VEVAPFLDGMRELGYTDGKNIRYEWRFADGDYSRLRALAEELVALKVDVLAASSTPAVRAAQQATRAIPIVMVSVVDPVRMGFVASLAQPGGNITGSANLSEEVWIKQVDVLLETFPKLKRVAVLVNPDEQYADITYKAVADAGKRHNIEMLAISARSAAEIEQAFAAIKQQRGQALLVAGGAFFVQRRSQLTTLAGKARLPAIYSRREYVEAGGLMSYGRNAALGYRRASIYVDKILKGAKPGELPVDQVSVIELVLNQTAAKAIGVTFPGKILARADKIID
jgi:putative ABC transport system substrate-binding protein